MQSLSYEQCVRLRDAGFPQTTDHDISEVGTIRFCDGSGTLSSPTCDEIIEDLGSKVSEICRVTAKLWGVFDPENVASDYVLGCGIRTQAPRLIDALAEFYLAVRGDQAESEKVT